MSTCIVAKRCQKIRITSGETRFLRHQMYICSNTHEDMLPISQSALTLHKSVTKSGFTVWQTHHASLLEPDLCIRLEPIYFAIKAREGSDTVRYRLLQIACCHANVWKRKKNWRCGRWSKNRLSSLNTPVRMLCWLEIEFWATMPDDITERHPGVMLAGDDFSYWVVSS